jgi:hypothetical protein
MHLVLLSIAPYTTHAPVARTLKQRLAVLQQHELPWLIEHRD